MGVLWQQPQPPTGNVGLVPNDPSHMPETSPDNILPVEHNKHYGLEPLLADNIRSSEYFKSLYRYSTVDQVVEEFSTHAKI
eukprot:UN24052